MAEVLTQRLRREIRSRAEGRCEYCLISESLLLAGCEVDHVISRKHGGTTEFSNLALSCARCNRFKGTDVGALHPSSGQFIRLFNPRLDCWNDHFLIDGPRIAGTTAIGQVTVRLLRLNDEERILERGSLQRAGLYRTG